MELEHEWGECMWTASDLVDFQQSQRSFRLSILRLFEIPDGILHFSTDLGPSIADQERAMRADLIHWMSRTFGSPGIAGLHPIFGD